ncbi:MAG: MCP four helix bundle domain-containing protein [Desulfomonile sp.]|nr:MCP four helix bundle domain-containing protein [Desulfomonile sp.]
MWKPLSLRNRILLMLCALVSITVIGGLVSIWHTYMMEQLIGQVLDTDLPALRAARDLKSGLVVQKGYVTYYLQDGDTTWLNELNAHIRAFETALQTARQSAAVEEERTILNEIESSYVRYNASRDEVIRLFQEGKQEEAFSLQKKARERFFAIQELCDRFRELTYARIEQARLTARRQAMTVNRLALAALACVVVIGAVLAYTLLRNVLEPIRQLAVGPGEARPPGAVQDEVKALGQRFHKLLSDFDQTKSKLEWSREHLQQADKWALVGKLAASVAHSVRNPLTSVKMRLFSLERNLALTSEQKEDVEVISEEIRHIDGIVNNFLEFARPPKLKIQSCSPSDVVDTAVMLLRHRLESYSVTVEVRRGERLPQVPLDPDQLKEVLVNLMVNSCEAMVHGGSIWIDEELGESGALSPAVIIRLSDNGPGVPKSIQSKMFQPFFSTKEEGTGLGLSIATRIVEEHGGWIDLKSKEGEGATFIITLPVREA